MRNSKVKGFTLVELIVVIAIIAILAAILVPNMLGYIRNSRFSQADANAKNVSTAATAAVAQAYADGKLGSGGAGLVDGTKAAIGTGRKVTIGGVVLDLTNGLGDKFNGSAAVWYDTQTYSITGAAWKSEGTTADIPDVIPATRNKSDKSTPIIGYFPIPTDPSTSAAASGSGT